MSQRITGKGTSTEPVPVTDNGGSLTVDGPLTDAQLRASAVPVSAASLPLPSGAATAARQDTQQNTLAVINSKLPSALASDRLKVDGSGVTQPMSAASLPLPAGAATEAKQDTGNTSLSNLDGKTPALVGGRVPVDGSGVTQPVSGPLTDAQLRATAVPISAASLPLPSGAATEATLASLNGKFIGWTPKVAKVAATATSSTGDKLTVDPPAGKRAIITGYLAIGINSLVRVASIHYTGGTGVKTRHPATGGEITVDNCWIPLPDGDSFAINVTTASATTQADFLIAYLEEP